MRAWRATSIHTNWSLNVEATGIGTVAFFFLPLRQGQRLGYEMLVSMRRELAIPSGEPASAGPWQAVARAHVYTTRGDRIEFSLLRNGRRYKWWGIPADVTTSKKAAWKALEEYADAEYPGRLITPDPLPRGTAT